MKEMLEIEESNIYDEDVESPLKTLEFVSSELPSTNFHDFALTLSQYKMKKR